MTRFQRQRTITLKSNTLAAISGDVTNVVAGIPAATILPELLSYGHDVEFVDGAGTILPHDVQWQSQVGFKGGVFSGVGRGHPIYAAGKMFFGFVGNSNVTDTTQEEARVGCLDLATGVITESGKLVTIGQTDDHNDPSLYIRTDGRILACYAGHGDDSLNRFRITDVAHDVTTFAAEQTLTSQGTVTYAVLHLIGTRLYWFFRSSNGSLPTWWYRISDDEGLTWSASEYAFVHQESGSAGYWNGCIFNGRLHIVMDSGNPTTDDNIGVYYCYAVPSGDIFSFFKSSGSQIARESSGGVLACNAEDMTLLSLGDDVTGEFNLSQIEVRPNGRPRVISTRATDDGSVRRYVCFEFDGTSWSEEAIVDSGINLTDGETDEKDRYFGWYGFDYTDLDRSTIWLSRGPADGTKYWNVERWKRHGAADWRLDLALTDVRAPNGGNDTACAIHPVGVVDAPANGFARMLYLSGYYLNNYSAKWSLGVYVWPPLPATYWVRVPTMASAADTTLTMRYRALNAHDRSRPAQVWQDAYYATMFDLEPGTWYVNDRSIVHPPAKRRFATRLDANSSGRWNRIAGPFGQAPAIEVPNYSTVALHMNASAANFNFASLTALTIEFLVYMTKDNATLYLWGQSQDPLASGCYLRVTSSAGVCTPQSAVIISAITARGPVSGPTFLLNTWAHIVMRFDRGGEGLLRTVTNGVLGSGLSVAAALDAGASPAPYIGIHFSSGGQGVGSYAFCRVTKSALSADRLKINDALLRQMSSFVTLGASSNI